MGAKLVEMAEMTKNFRFIYAFSQIMLTFAPLGRVLRVRFGRAPHACFNACHYGTTVTLLLETPHLSHRGETDNRRHAVGDY